MASIVMNIAKANWMKATLDMDAASNIRARLAMDNTNADSETGKDADTVAGMTLDESDDGSYAAQTLTTLSVVTEDTANEGQFQSDNVTFNLAGDGTRDYKGMLLVDNVDGGGGDIPVAFIEFTGQPIAKEVTQIVVTMPSGGWVKIA